MDDSRLTTGLIRATRKISCKSTGLKLLTPNEQPCNVPSSTRSSSQPQNSARWPSAGICGLCTSRRLGMKPSSDKERDTDALSSSRECSLGPSGVC
jgi:hypothetical protein